MDINQVLEWIKPLISGNSVWLLVVAAAVVLYWDKIKSLVGPLLPAKNGPSRIHALTLADELYEHFKAEGCKDGMEAMKLAIARLYQDHPHE